MSFTTLIQSGADAASDISQLLGSSQQENICGCKTERAVHVVNELITPKVNYESWTEFARLVYQVQDDYCSCLATAVHNELSQHKTSVVLGSVCLIHSTPINLPHLQKHGSQIIARLTKNKGMFWCQMVAHLVYTRVIRAASIYNDVLTFGTDFEDDIDLNKTRIDCMVHIMQQEIRHTFSGAMPFSIYTLCSGFVSTLLVKNFVFFDNSDFTAFTDSQFHTLILTLCTGLHARLGKLSPLHVLDSELLQFICSWLQASQLLKHLVFHTQEQWLCS